MTARNETIATGSFFLFVGIVIAVGLRYAVNGPENDRSQPSILVTQAETHLTNIGMSEIEHSPGVRELLFQVVAAGRRALPPPTGTVIHGEIQYLTEAQKREIAKQDEAALEPLVQSDEETPKV
jgi:hypothetical protein